MPQPGVVKQRPASPPRRLSPALSHLNVAAPDRPDAPGSGLVNLTLGHRTCQPTSRVSLEALGPGDYQHILVLADESVDPELADNRTLVTLLHLRDIEEALGDPYSIVSEMNNDSNREVAQVTKADDFDDHIIVLAESE
ncbi:hypothetical protein ABZ442_17810 [Streptomyces triculaminicus]|uniref:hypothetical protein n=1 Tax=Streptomyces triculaminicus TaxID=2816232 RepID=UPI00340D11BB